MGKPQQPMNDTELKQFKDLAKKYEAKDKDAVLKIMQDDIHDVFQEAHDQGHSAATRKADDKEKSLVRRAEAAEKKATDLETKLAELGDKAPTDVKALQKQHDLQLEQLKKDHQAELEKAKGEATGSLVDKELQLLVTELVGEYNVDKEYATAVIAKRDDIKKRIQPNAAGAIEVLQDGKTTPYTPTAEKTAIQLLAAELAPKINTKWKNSAVKRGSGTRSGDGTQQTDGSHYDNIRKGVKDKDKAKAETAKKSGLERLGGAPRR